MKKIIIIISSYLIIFFNTNLLSSDKDEILKVGLLAPLSGEYKELGNSLLYSLQLALDEIGDDKVFIIPRDSGLNDKKKLTAYNDKIKSLPRQQYQNIYTLNGSLYLSTKDSLCTNKSFVTPKTIGYVMSDKYSLDIDTQLDWDLAEFIMRKYSNEKLDFIGS